MGHSPDGLGVGCFFVIGAIKAAIGAQHMGALPNWRLCLRTQQVRFWITHG